LSRPSRVPPRIDTPRYLDLIGLPRAAEVDAFVKDTSPNAWAKVVDGLLASPRYGERWGRHWLDLARYAAAAGSKGQRIGCSPGGIDYGDVTRSSGQAYDEFFARTDRRGRTQAQRIRTPLIATGYLACGPQDIVETTHARVPTNWMTLSPQGFP